MDSLKTIAMVFNLFIISKYEHYLYFCVKHLFLYVKVILFFVISLIAFFLMSQSIKEMGGLSAYSALLVMSGYFIGRDSDFF